MIIVSVLVRRGGQKSGLEFSGGGTAGYMVENSENSVCPRPLLQFLQFFSVSSV